MPGMARPRVGAESGSYMGGGVGMVGMVKQNSSMGGGGGGRPPTSRIIFNKVRASHLTSPLLPRSKMYHPALVSFSRAVRWLSANHCEWPTSGCSAASAVISTAEPYSSARSRYQSRWCQLSTPQRSRNRERHKARARSARLTSSRRLAPQRMCVTRQGRLHHRRHERGSVQHQNLCGILYRTRVSHVDCSTILVDSLRNSID